MKMMVRLLLTVTEVKMVLMERKMQMAVVSVEMRKAEMTEMVVMLVMGCGRTFTDYGGVYGGTDETGNDNGGNDEAL